MRALTWQVPQYALIGVDEVLASVAQLELFYAESPSPMRSVCMALQLVSNAVGSYFSALLLQFVELVTHKQPWITENLNQGKLHYFFFLLAALMVVNLLLFGFVARRFEAGKVPAMTTTRDGSEPKPASDRL